ncbi:MAG: hypothetical protein KGJ86_13520 [Chloroflexota bacterium]|nr:hypothetical protein [Chloroflexota bacterium]
MRVDAGDNFFSPSDITVKLGMTVTWHNQGEGEVPHDVLAKDGSFQSGSFLHGDAFSYTFTRTGRYEYVCTYHIQEGMVGVISVLP